jgi:hypothetical protein
MSLRKKLYYDLRVTSLGISLNGLGTANPRALRFVGGTGPNSSVGAAGFPGAEGDRYGNVMDPNLGLSNDPAAALAADLSLQRSDVRAIGGWFSTSTSNTNIPDDICVDFITETAPVVATAASIDPATVRRPRARLTSPATLVGPVQEFGGVLYLQRQHSEEV